jgi:hypothetical protein
VSHVKAQNQIQPRRAGARTGHRSIRSEDLDMHDTSKWSVVGTRADHVTIRTAGAWIRVVERGGHWRRVDIRNAPDSPLDMATAVRTDRNGRLTLDAGETGLCQVEVSPGMPVRIIGTGRAWVIADAPSASLSVDLRADARAEVVRAAIVSALLKDRSQLAVERRIDHLEVRCADQAQLVTADMVDAPPFESGLRVPAGE